MIGEGAPMKRADGAGVSWRAARGMELAACRAVAAVDGGAWWPACVRRASSGRRPEVVERAVAVGRAGARERSW